MLCILHGICRKRDAQILYSKNNDQQRSHSSRRRPGAQSVTLIQPQNLELISSAIISLCICSVTIQSGSEVPGEARALHHSSIAENANANSSLALLLCLLQYLQFFPHLLSAPRGKMFDSHLANNDPNHGARAWKTRSWTHFPVLIVTSLLFYTSLYSSHYIVNNKIKFFHHFKLYN